LASSDVGSYHWHTSLVVAHVLEQALCATYYALARLLSQIVHWRRLLGCLVTAACELRCMRITDMLLSSAAWCVVAVALNYSCPACSLCAVSKHTCTICLGEYEGGEELRRLPCLHAFHRPCIDAWMASNHTCPICRLDLIGEQQP
jgi:hypothetical protein